jgi:hypothetical protein
MLKASQNYLASLINSVGRTLIVQAMVLSGIGWIGEILLRQLGDKGDKRWG